MSDIYFIASNDITLYLSNNVCNIILEKKDDKSNKNYYSYYSINDSGKLILKSIRGDEELNTFILRFCEENSLDYTLSKNWISDFLYDMAKKDVLLISKIPKSNYKVIPILGEKELTSPMHFTFEVTEKCNLYCAHCYLSAACQKTTQIDFSKFQEIVLNMKQNKACSIELTGGEFFLHKDYYKILELAFQEFGHVGLLTNGTILPKKALQLLIENKDRLFVSISLDSSEEEIHDSFRGKKGSFKNTCKNIKKLSDAGIFVRVASCIFDNNMWEIDKIADLSIKLGAKFYSYNFVENFGRGKDFVAAGFDSKEKAKEYASYVNDVVEKYRDIIPIIQEESHLKVSDNCGAGTNSILVGADGYLRPCALFPKTVLFGNVFQEGYDDIFNKEIYKEISNIKSPNIENGCFETCENLFHCRGCYMKGLESNVDSDVPCKWIQSNNYENLLNLYKEGKKNYVSSY